MARRRGPIDEDTIQRWLRNGRGQGVQEDYESWLKTYDVPSKGLRTRLRPLGASRVLHLLSNLEKAALLMNEAREDLSEIREQFPLDRVITHRIALAAGIRHPTTSMGTPYVMTTDLLLTLCGEGNAVAFEAIAVKPSSALKDLRVREKLEIERRYWLGYAVPWRVFTECDVDRTLVQHLDTLRLFWHVEPFVSRLGTGFQLITQAWLDVLDGTSEAVVQDVCRIFAARFGFDPQSICNVLRHLVARKIVATDLSDPRRIPFRQLKEFRVAGPRTSGGV